MRVLVTGCHGYIGSVLTPMLSAAGHEVVGVDADFYKHCALGNEIHELPCITKDVRDVGAADLDGIEAIVHLAALSNDPLGNSKPGTTYAINHWATIRLAELAKSVGVQRFVFSSSCSTYGAAEGEELLNEHSPLNPVTPYGHSKVLADRHLQELADDGFSPVLLRNATCYGFSPRLRLDLVVNEFVASAATTGRLVIKSDGSPWRPLVHVEDVCRAMFAALDAPREAVHNQIFNVGQTDENYQIRDVAEIVREVVPNCEVQYGKQVNPDRRCYRVSCEKIAEALPDFRPAWTVRTGAQQLYDAFRTLDLTAEDLEGPRFYRLRTLRLHADNGRLREDFRWVSPAVANALVSSLPAVTEFAG